MVVVECLPSLAGTQLQVPCLVATNQAIFTTETYTNYTDMVPIEKNVMSFKYLGTTEVSQCALTTTQRSCYGSVAL